MIETVVQHQPKTGKVGAIFKAGLDPGHAEVQTGIRYITLTRSQNWWRVSVLPDHTLCVSLVDDVVLAANLDCGNVQIAINTSVLSLV